MEQNIYTISDIEFILFTNWDMDESDYVTGFYDKLYMQTPNIMTIAKSFSSDDIEKFLEIVLKPAHGKSLPEGFSFRKAKKDIQLKVIGDVSFLFNEQGKDSMIKYLKLIDNERAIKELKNLKDYKSQRFKSKVNLTFKKSIILYLNGGNPTEIKKYNKTKEEDVLNYYYIIELEI